MGDQTFRSLAERHLQLHLRVLNRALRDAVERQAKESAGLDQPEVAHLAITDRHARLMVDRVVSIADPDGGVHDDHGFGPDERDEEHRLRNLAASHDRSLPLDELAAHFDLDDRDVAALVACAAPEVDRGYHRLYAYLLDDIRRVHACPEILALLEGGAAGALLARWRGSRFGPLRRLGIVVAVGESATDLRCELRLAHGLFDFLMGARIDLGLVADDPGDGPRATSSTMPPHVDDAIVARLAAALRGAIVEIVGIWGADGSGREGVAHALAAGCGRPLRRIDVTGTNGASNNAVLVAALQHVAVHSAIAWIALPDLTEDNGRSVERAVDELIRRTSAPIILTGVVPSRPQRAIERRAYAEIELADPGYADRREMWLQALPEVDGAGADDLAARYRMGAGDIGSVAAIARTSARIMGPDTAITPDRLDMAASAVTRKRSDRFAAAVTPRRRLADLVLPESEFLQIVEIGSFHRAWPTVAERWGFAQIMSDAGIKALFVGDPGTGKTMAAEVIAGELGVILLKIDLAQVVSKWVGETEKNLEAAFREAEASHCVLFFDEADALFGKRGEVRHGTDRYANLEVGYLLQRLERYEGLVILASNMQENIDAAFGRRFHFVVHFPRPDGAQRARLWRQVFPDQAPLAADTDLELLAGLELTGAGITAAARTAALLAADEGESEIAARHLVRAVRRQFQREGRVLKPTDLREYASLM